MTSSRWDALPEDLHQRVDALVLDGQTFAAIGCLTGAGLQPQLSLVVCMELVAARCDVLSDRITAGPPQPASVESLLTKVASLPTAPEAIEAIWDGDTFGWLVVLLAVSRTLRTEYTLTMIRHGGDLRLFNGEVPPWPDAEEAARLGAALANRLAVPFHFASPHTPDDDAPRWWDT